MSRTPAENVAPRAVEVLENKSSEPVGAERRTEVRRPTTIGFHVVPLDRRGKPLNAAAFTASGKNISASGLAVSHLLPMEYPRALITSMGTSAERIQVEAEVAWTGPAGNGVYETGFKVIRRIV